MLKITRLDTGNILFEKQSCFIPELIKNAISKLTTRATQKRKQIIVNGTPNQTVISDMDWTSEAIGNLVKNALDHTEAELPRKIYSIFSNAFTAANILSILRELD